MTGSFVKISDEDLPKLAKLYRKCVSWAPYAESVIHMAIRWKKSEKYKNLLNIWSFSNTWQEDGSIVVVLESYRNDVFVFTLNEDGTSISQAFMEANLIDYTKRTLFYGIHEKHISPLMKYFENKKNYIKSDCFCYIYVLPPEEAKLLTIECPSELYLKKLDISAAKQINDVWPYKFPGSEKYIAIFIEMNGGWGLFLKSTNEMVAWVLRHFFDELGMLQVEENHKRKGYGSLITKVIAKEIGEEGRWSVGHILLDNYASIKTLEKLGFRNISSCIFTQIELAEK